jgi:hypothetical protein
MSAIVAKLARMAMIGDWLAGHFDLFGITFQNWMVAVPTGDLSI